MTVSPYDQDLDRNAANFQPLTPLAFLERAAFVFPDRLAIVHGALRRNYRDFYARARQLGSALARRGFGQGDTIAVMLANTPAMLECHYGVPMSGAVLNALNTRLDPATLAFMLDHGEAKALFVDREHAAAMRAALSLCKVRPLLIDYDDPEFTGPGDKLGGLDYEALLAEGDPLYAYNAPQDEWDAISLNYTSGTTGDPKGVVYHHRGANLLALGNVVTADMGRHPVYLWTLPMFHANGWCFPWSISVKAGVHICLRQVRAKQMYDLIVEHGVTHLCGAPIVMSTLLNAPDHEKRALPHLVRFFTAAAPPPAAVLAAMREAGFEVTHLYGLTETYGPAVVNDWQDHWNDLGGAEQAALKSRQGVRYHALDALDVMDPDTMQSVPADGETLGEVMFRGNVVMKGYLKNKPSTDKAFEGGWFHSGDLGVKHPDGYVQLKDRSKDIIISGGENISSIEVEDALFQHPAVQLAAVVARPDEKWGETPCAFVELKPEMSASAEELIEWCKGRLAGYKRPRHIVFMEIPKTSTGKVQKFVLRERARTIDQA
jgi:fatty-acyl-CoA synthase